MSTYRAPQGLLTDEGYFALRLRYTPGYGHGDVVGIHTLIQFGDTCRVYYDGATSTMVLDVDGYEVASSALTFSAGQELTVEVEHTDVRRRIRVAGATTGDSLVEAVARPPAVIASQLYILGLQAGAEQPSTLVSLELTQGTTFATFASDGLLAQSDGDVVLEAMVAALATEPATSYDTALTIRDAFDLDHAVGSALDLVGSIVGLTREGYADSRYRDFLRIQVELILAQARADGEWTGTAANVIRIVRTFVGAAAPVVRYVSYPPYSYTITVEDLVYSEAFLLQRFLRTATYAGVLGLIQIELGDEESVMGSTAVAVPREGIMGSASVVVPDAMIMGTVLEVA